jgi:hypothetical protein
LSKSTALFFPVIASLSNTLLAGMIGAYPLSNGWIKLGWPQAEKNVLKALDVYV